MIIESHAHYSHKRYDGTFRYLTGQLTAEEGNRDGLLKRLRESGVALCIEPAIGFDSNRLTAALYRQHPDFFRLAVGVHPTRTAQVPWRQRKQLATWARGPGVAAIGETGLDYHRPRHHRLVQLLWFRYQLDLARRTGLPLVLHIRMADRDALPMLRRRRRWLPGGVVHCFQGGWETARQYLDLGLCLGIGGALLRQESAPCGRQWPGRRWSGCWWRPTAPMCCRTFPGRAAENLWAGCATPPCCCPGSLRRSHGLSGCRRRRWRRLCWKIPGGCSACRT